MTPRNPTLRSVPGNFLSEVAAVEQQTPLLPPPLPPPDPADPKYAAAPDLLTADIAAHAAAVAAFGVAAKTRGGAIAQLISRWLTAAPYSMLQQLLDQPSDTMPIFRPAVGPVIVMRQPHVIECLARTDLFTVDPYAAEMARATDDKTKNPGAFSHFMLGTDNDALYRLDDVLLRRVVGRGDEATLAALARREAEASTAAATASGRRELDIVSTIAKFVPLRIVGDYLGVPFADHGQPSALPGLRGGDPLPLDDDLQKEFTFSKIQEGLVATADDLYGWVKDAFRNSFNNFNPGHPRFGEFRERGLIATEYLTAYVYALLKHYKAQLLSGHDVPDTMLTRLLRLQAHVNGKGGASLEADVSSQLSLPLPPGELARRLSDSMIRSNVFGTVVGAVVNPQEATARIVDSMLCLKDGEYETVGEARFAHAVSHARINESEAGYAASLQIIMRYALEALRLRPQGEVVLRLCAQDNTVLAGTLVRKGTPVFVAHAAAMRDPAAVRRPLAFDIARDDPGRGYLADKERAHEAPQSLLYLQHGFGRHKCLGRYASELTMRESLRAVLRLDGIGRLSDLVMDDQGLYAESLRIAVP